MRGRDSDHEANTRGTRGKCLLCEEEAIHLFCPAHRPAWIPEELERPAADPDADTADLRPERANEEARS